MKLEELDYETFAERFSSEEACINELFAAKWPDGFRCPHCGGRHACVIRTRRLPLYECAACRRQTSLTAGTVLEGSRTPLSKWFRTLYLVAQLSHGINAVRLAEIIAVTYKTAWLMLHKIRHAMHTADSCEPLTGIVRMNAGKYGNPYSPFDNRHPKEHPVIVGVSVNREGAFSQIKIKQLEDEHLFPGTKNVEPWGWVAFRKQHIDPSAERIERGRSMYDRLFRDLRPVYEAAAKRINDTYHGIGAKHLQFYLDEYVYRYNVALRNEPIFARFLERCASTFVLTYPALIGKNRISHACMDIDRIAS